MERLGCASDSTLASFDLQWCKIYTALWCYVDIVRIHSPKTLSTTEVHSLTSNWPTLLPTMVCPFLGATPIYQFVQWEPDHVWEWSCASIGISGP
jgi:hypothetical protein